MADDLKKGWSPEQTAGRLRYEHNREEMDMSISYETIYAWIYVHPKGELERAGIILRTGREQRKPAAARRPLARRSSACAPSEDRPAEVTGRQVPGHREGDLVIGKAGKSAMDTLVERVSRYLCPVALSHGHDADSVKDALSARSRYLRRSLTWDQGTEMARNAALSPPYPHRRPSGVFRRRPFPCERGTNENTNSLIREYLPKGTGIPGDIDYL